MPPEHSLELNSLAKICGKLSAYRLHIYSEVWIRMSHGRLQCIILVIHMYTCSFTWMWVGGRTLCHKFCCIFPQQFVWERGPLSEFPFGAFPRKELQQQCLFFCGPLRKFLWLLRANWCRQCLLCIEVKMLSSSAAGMLFASMNLCQGCNPWEFPQERFYTSNQVMMSSWYDASRLEL